MITASEKSPGNEKKNRGNLLSVEKVKKISSVFEFHNLMFQPAELCKLVGLAYDVGPPKMCSLKLGNK